MPWIYCSNINKKITWSTRFNKGILAEPHICNPNPKWSLFLLLNFSPRRISPWGQAFNAIRRRSTTNSTCRIAISASGKAWWSFWKWMGYKVSGLWWCLESWYCWWFRNPANQLRLVVFPMIYKVSYIPGAAGVLPSTVWHTSKIPKNALLNEEIKHHRTKKNHQHTNQICILWFRQPSRFKTYDRVKLDHGIPSWWGQKIKKILQSTANKTDWISCIENIHEIHSSWHLFVVMLVDKKEGPNIFL